MNGLPRNGAYAGGPCFAGATNPHNNTERGLCARPGIERLRARGRPLRIRPPTVCRSVATPARACRNNGCPTMGVAMMTATGCTRTGPIL
eukprot:3174185-Lingulodinium_polyedra.AAC.1